MKKIAIKSLMLFVLAAFMVVFLCVFASAGHDHIYDGENKPATLTEDGHAEMRCQICGYVFEDRVVPKIASVKLEKTEFTYNGEYAIPKVIVKDSEGRILEEFNDYQFSWRYYKKIGTYTCKVKFRGNYKGEVELTYKIVSPLSTPKLKAVKSTIKGAKIEWEKKKSATGYIVYRKSGSGSWKRLGTTKKIYYVDSTAVYNKTYKYTVKAYYKPKSGSTQTSGYDKKGLTLKMAKVVTPSAPTVSSKSLYASIKIKEVKGATKYNIYKATSKDGEYKLIHTAKKDKLTYTDKKVKINKTYYYKIRAYVGSKASSLSAYDNVLIKLDTPKINKTVNVDSSTFTFKWGKIKGADYYRIYRRENSGSDWKRIKTVKAGEKLTYKGKLSNTVNDYAVIAYKKLSSKTTVKSKMSEDLSPHSINKPTIRFSYPGSTNTNVKVFTNIGFASYAMVYCKEGKDGKWKLVEEAYDNFMGDEFVYSHKLKMDTPYYFAVKGYYKSGDFKIYGPASDTAYIKLHYNPDVQVVLPKETYKSSAFPVTIKNNSANTLRLYSDAYLSNEDFTRSGPIFVFDPYYEYLNENGYVDIAPYSSVTITFLPRAYSEYNKDIHYNRKCSIVFKFRQNGVDYYSGYSNYYGKSFLLNKE